MRGWPTVRDWLYSLAGIAGVVVLLALLMAPSGGFPARPRFQSVGIGEAAPTGTGGLAAARIGTAGGAPAGAGQIEAGGTIIARGNVSLLAASTTNPTVEFNMQDATADNSRWQLGAQAETFVGRALNDAGSAISRFLEVERTGATIDSVNLLGTAVRANGVAIARVTVSQSAPSGAGMLVGDTIIVSKSADTTRANTAVSAIDPHLQITALPAGHYIIELFLRHTHAANGFRFQVDTPSPVAFAGNEVCGNNGIADWFLNDTDEVCNTDGGTSLQSFRGASAKIQATGTVSISWAQNVSGASGATLESDSWLKVTRIN